MNREDAEIMLAKVLKKEYDYYQKRIEPLVIAANTNTHDFVDEYDVIEIPENIQQEYDALHDDVNMCGDELASYPQFFDIMKCWMIDVCGEGRKEIPKNFLETDIDIDEFLDQYGNLAHSVTNFVKKSGFVITDRGGGSTGWHFGVPCTDTEANKLCSLLHQQFSGAIELDLIAVYKRFWGHRLPNLYNWDSLLEWLETHELEEDEE